MGSLIKEDYLVLNNIFILVTIKEVVAVTIHEISISNGNSNHDKNKILAFVLHMVRIRE